MIFAALLLLAQDATAAGPEAAENEIVVSAVYGRTTMLFDKGADGRLDNCRIMVSSGSAKRDRNACQATPVCYAGTADQVIDCVPFASVAAVDVPKPSAGAKPVDTFTIPQLVKPQAGPSPTLVGPVRLTEDSRDTDRQRVKLPPLPKAPSGGSGAPRGAFCNAA